jgi:acyl carrier protein
MSTNGAKEAATAGFTDFVELAAAWINLRLEGARPEDRLVDLGLDSIAMFELFVLLEDAAVHDLPVELIDSLETLGDVWHWHTTLAAQHTNGADHSDGTVPQPQG